MAMSYLTFTMTYGVFYYTHTLMTRKVFLSAMMPS